IARRLCISRVDVGKNPEEPRRTEAQVVCEITVESDMANALGTLHGGCIALLLDVCTSLPCNLMAYEIRKSTACGVSQNINILYHAPGHMGSELRITSSLVSYGSRVISSRCEIWDKTHRRLIATGGQTMMQPSHPKTPDHAVLETALNPS
ncbi:HotDog domain-containing protein, partial [Hysterangium stoloniferum]